MPKNLNWLAVSVLALATAGCGGGSAGSSASEGGTPAPPPAPSPSPSPSPTPSPTPTPPPPPPASLIGMNVSFPAYWGGERNFMNLAMGSGGWASVRNYQWTPMDPSRVDADGAVRSLAADEGATLMLTPPGHFPDGIAIRCTWSGTGTLSASGVPVSNSRQQGQTLDFTWKSDAFNYAHVWINLERTDPADPVRALDCREADAPRNTTFSQDFIDYLRPFGVIRFMDWVYTNDNLAGNWNDRTPPTAFYHRNGQGVAIEHMIELVNTIQRDPWFNIPYNADENYNRRFAQMVHDRIPANRKVYIELSNEVWNYVFPVATQAKQEGLDRGLSSVGDGHQALLFRYAQKATAAFKIWSEVFADRPNQLVRVIATQSANPWSAEQVLGFQDTAQHADALATAPYFGIVDSMPGVTDARTISDLAVLLAEQMDSTFAIDRRNKEIATSYGLRYITYEAGHHALISNVQLNTALQRSSTIYDLYGRYFNIWFGQFGDLMMLYNSTGMSGQYGAWGHREYSGQPLSDTPKVRAILDELDRQRRNP